LAAARDENEFGAQEKSVGIISYGDMESGRKEREIFGVSEQRPTHSLSVSAQMKARAG